MTQSAAGPLSLTQHQLFSAADCDDIQRRVIDLREHWIQRSNRGFYSLAAASYLDAPGRRDEYLECARKTNPILLDQFSDVYAIVISFFEKLLFAPVLITNEAAVPGFHIFELDRCGSRGDPAAMRAHFDLQWMHAFPGWQPDATLSFTVAIEQPPNGAALEVWTLTYANAVMSATPAQKWAASHPGRRLHYIDGGITVHDGNVLHAIGSRPPGDPPGRRLTLQGHGVQFEGRWMLYW